LQKKTTFVTFTHDKKYMVPKSLLYIVAIMLAIGWLLGVFVWHAGHLIYILLILSVISLILAVIKKKEMD